MSFSVASLLLLMLGIVALSIAGYAWQRRSMPGALPLSLMGFSLAVWSCGYAMELSSLTLSTILWWVRLEYAGIVIAPITWLWFAAEYTGSFPWLDRRRVWLLGIVPALTMIIILTNDVHQLFWQSIILRRDGFLTIFDATYGFWFWVHTTHAYLCLLTGTFFIIRLIWRTPQRFYYQIGALVLGVAAPWIGNVIYLSGVSPLGKIDLTPFAFTVSLAMIAWSLFRLRMFEIRPIVRDMVLQSIRDGMMAIDEHGWVVEVNRAAATLIGLSPSQIVGKRARDVLARWPDVLERYREVREAADEIEVMIGTERYWFDVRIQPICDAHQAYHGRLVVWRDISAERRIREELQRNNERLLAAQQELIAARDAAEAGNRAKSAFLAHMSHEIRTPLMAIAGYCHLLETGIEHQSLAQTRIDLEAIRVATGRLLDLANNVLEMAQIESGRTELHEVAFDVAEMVRDVSAVVRPLLRRNRNRLALVGTETVGMVQGDAAKVRQVLLNLMSNAVKFTTDGEVEIRVACEALEGARQRLRFWVRDTGRGIAHERMATLFTPFAIAEEEIGREQRGVGLGLVISQHYCRLMGGELSIDSAPGGGTCATFWVPVHTPQMAVAEVSQER